MSLLKLNGWIASTRSDHNDPVQGIFLPLLFGYPWSKAVTDLLQSRTLELGSERDLGTSSKIHLERQRSTSHSYSRIMEFHSYYLTCVHSLFLPLPLSSGVSRPDVCLVSLR
ncbi:hypothetical protein K435DRAFT_199012 [Dendrothele bispora CBS 962.96]|uniref:Uncharacterized protein n=1 Tax=Dendrothele bispora (strain CBS 962.96) TaxID=1314807 RepID=A0A4S8KKI5_DENBC|nr:hypothetical protein K435DRAFT_199012 [Dendrothele bispora CBS 962.96]